MEVHFHDGKPEPAAAFPIELCEVDDLRRVLLKPGRQCHADHVTQLGPRCVLWDADGPLREKKHELRLQGSRVDHLFPPRIVQPVSDENTGRGDMNGGGAVVAQSPRISLESSGDAQYAKELREEAV